MEQHQLRTAASNVQAMAVNKYKQAATVIDGYVSENPWRAVGIATAIGALIGLLAARR